MIKKIKLKLSKVLEILGSMFLSTGKHLSEIAYYAHLNNTDTPMLQEEAKEDTKKEINYITSFFEYDEFIDKCRSLLKDEDKLRILMDSHILDGRKFIEQFDTNQTDDPFSAEYSEWEKKFFEFLSDSDYLIDKEGMEVKTDDEIDEILNFPMYASWKIEKYIAFHEKVFDLLRVLNLDKSSRVIEMGFGGGGLIDVFCRLGFNNLSAIDISPAACEIVRRRCAASGITANVHCGQFFDIENLNSGFDTIVFDSSFHHCDDPVRLLSALRKKISQNGQLAFLNEPIMEHAERPWGIIRYDGECIMQIRMRGWMEMGIREDFFIEALKRTGWSLSQRHIGSYSGAVPLFVAKPY